MPAEKRTWTKIDGKICHVPCYVYQRSKGRRYCSSCNIGTWETRRDRRRKGENVPIMRNGPRNGKPPIPKSRNPP